MAQPFAGTQRPNLTSKKPRLSRLIFLPGILGVVCASLTNIKSPQAAIAPQSYSFAGQQSTRPLVADRGYAEAAKRSDEAKVLRSQWNEQSLRDAITKYIEASRTWQSAGYHNEAGAALINIGDVYSILSEYEAALHAYEKALKLAESTGKREAEMDALNGVGYALSNLGSLDQALQILKRVQHYCESESSTNTSANQSRRLAQALNNIGEVHYTKGDLQMALGYFNRGLALFTESSDPSGQALVHLNIGYTYYDSGDFRQASTHYEQSLALRKSTGDLRGEALARTALGGVYSIIGENQLALDAHTKAMKILRTVGDHLGEAAALNGIGRAYEELNQSRTALDNYISARDQFRRTRKTDYEALSNYYIGRVYRSLKRMPDALRSYEECIALSRKAGNRRFENYALKDIAIVQNATGNREKALDLFGQVLQYYQSVKDKRGEAYVLSGIGYTQLLAGQPAEAIGNFKAALSLSRSIMDRSAEVAFLYYAALAERALGQPTNALGYISQSIQLIENTRTKVISRDLRVSYFAAVHEHYNFSIDLLMQMEKRQPNNGFAAKAFEIAEQGRSRSLLDSLNQAKLDLPSESDPSLATRLNDLRHLLNAKAEYQMRLVSDNPAPEVVAQTDKEIRDLTVQYNQLEAELRQQSPRYADLISAQPITLKEIQSQLTDENTLLVEFTLGTERSYAWVVSSKTINGYELPARKALEETALKVQELLMARQPIPGETPLHYRQRVAAAETQYWPIAARLSQDLLGSMKNQLAGRRLLIVPDGALHYVPFDALSFPADSESTGQPSYSYQPLILQQEIIKLPSAAVLIAVRRERVRATKTIVVLADPVFSGYDERLPQSVQTAFLQTQNVSKTSAIPSASTNGKATDFYIDRLAATQQEGNEIMKLVSAQEGKLVLGFDASHTFALSNELNQYRVIHMATHGTVDENHPELSGVVLSLLDHDGKPQDGFLRLHEIYNLRLTADLVVLSSCQTGLGKDVKGEGLIGLTRGFMYAGSKGVISSLWKVDSEATTELMKEFYTGFFHRGLSPASALREAKLAIRKQTRWQSPFFWAGFELHGEYAEPIDAGDNKLQRYLPLVLLILVAPLALYYFSKRFRRG
jgi:CHAT domain-containing protein/predicted negative regulator of RcsB-dependent stress response